MSARCRALEKRRCIRQRADLAIELSAMAIVDIRQRKIDDCTESSHNHLVARIGVEVMVTLLRMSAEASMSVRTCQGCVRMA